MMLANLKIYLLIVVELMLIEGVLVFADATHRSADREVGQLSRIYQEEEIYIVYHALDETVAYGGENAEGGITALDFFFLQERFAQEATLQFYIYDSVTVYEDGTFDTLYLVWGSDSFFEGVFGKEPGSLGRNRGVYGLRAGELLSNREAMLIPGKGKSVNQGRGWDSLSGILPAESIQYIEIEGEEYQLEPLDLDVGIPTSFIGTKIDSANCLFLPIAGRPEGWGQTNVGTMLSVSSDDFRRAPELVQEMISLLYDRHGGKFSYQYSNVLNDYLNRLDDIFEETDLFSFIARVCLCVAVFGITGVMTVLVRRRRREYAISYALGARKWNICLELLLEVFFVTGTGGVLGCMAGFLLTTLQLQGTVQIRFTPLCMATPVVLAFLIPLLTGFVVIPDISATDPIESMKSE